MTKSRIPPLWLVLLPALVLAAVGVRAVTAEMRATDEAARDRARSIASRLARSVDGLVAEYAAPLPSNGATLTTEAAEASMAHLGPAGTFEAPAAGASEGQGTWTSAPIRVETWDFVPDTERPLVEDALASAHRLAQAPGGALAAAALLDATARVVRSSSVLWPLRHEEAKHHLAAGDRDRAMFALAAAWRDAARGFTKLNGTLYPDAALELAAEIVGAAAPPEWLIAAYEHCARRPFFEGETAADVPSRPLAAGAMERLRPAHRLRSVARRLVASARGAPPPASVIDVDAGVLRVSLWRAVQVTPGVRCLLGGEIPAAVVEGRIVDEARALAAETGIASMRLAGADGSGRFDLPGGRSSGGRAVVESVPLAEPLSAWRAEAVVAPESGVPATAWMLAAALVLTTAALVAGSLALRRAAERSALLAEERRTFLDHVAHELRTPAAAVQALTEELASGCVPPDKEPLYREHLQNESRRLSALVEDTLDFARLDAGRLAFKMERLDVRDVVAGAIETCDFPRRATLFIPREPVVALADAGALRRSVKNLIENAVRHGGGDAPVRVALEASNGHASIVVADRGRGIAAEHLPHVFERFYRVPSATHDVKGIGLGLALCREVARAHGGDIGVESEPGKGSTFTLRIPRG